MGKLYILFAFMLLACREDDVKTQYDIYNEWSWVETDFASKVPYKTAAALDTTFYYNFQKNGILQIKDNNQNITDNKQFKITNDKLITINNARCSYSIDNDRLAIANIDGIIVWITVFKIVK